MTVVDLSVRRCRSCKHWLRKTVEYLDIQRKARPVGLVLWVGLLWGLAGCAGSTDRAGGPLPLAEADPTNEQANANTLLAVSDLGGLVVVKPDGEKIELAEYMGEQNLVLIFSRGYFGSICPFCSTQMHALAEAYNEFDKRGARVAVVFPVSQPTDRERWKELEASILEQLPAGSSVPFPILIDVELNAVDQLGIREELSKPSTFIIDQSKNLRYKYIGSDPADRPDVKTILKQLDGLSRP
jgi:peroxiredoxin